MYGHKRFDDTNAGPEGGPGFLGRRDRYDRLGGAPRGRVGGRGRGWEDAFGFGGGRHGAFGPGFGPPMFGRGLKRERGDVRAAILALLAEEPMHISSFSPSCATSNCPTAGCVLVVAPRPALPPGPKLTFACQEPRSSVCAAWSSCSMAAWSLPSKDQRANSRIIGPSSA